MFIVFFIAFCATLAAGKTGLCIFFAVLTVWSVCRFIFKDPRKIVEPISAMGDRRNRGKGDPPATNAGSGWQEGPYGEIVDDSNVTVVKDACGAWIYADHDEDDPAVSDEDPAVAEVSQDDA